MIAVIDECKVCDWQTGFVEMLPAIERLLRMAFCRLKPEAHEEAVEEGVVHCLLTYVRLHEQSRAQRLTPSSLAWYGSRQVKRGRPAVGRLNNKDPLSRYAQLSNAVQVEPLESGWIDTLVEDKRAPVLDQVAAKMDVGAWFGSLSRRMKQIARDLAHGFSTKEAAEKHGVTPGRISQLRRSLANSWAAFQHEPLPA